MGDKKRVVAIQLDLLVYDDKKYENLLEEIETLVNTKAEFRCMGIGFTDDITEAYYPDKEVDYGKF